VATFSTNPDDKNLLHLDQLPEDELGDFIEETAEFLCDQLQTRIREKFASPDGVICFGCASNIATFLIQEMVHRTGAGRHEAAKHLMKIAQHVLDDAMIISPITIIEAKMQSAARSGESVETLTKHLKIIAEKAGIDVRIQEINLGDEADSGTKH